MERKVDAIQENTLQTLGSVSHWDKLVSNEKMKLTKEVVMPEPTSYPLATVSVNKQSYIAVTIKKNWAAREAHEYH